MIKSYSNYNDYIAERTKDISYADYIAERIMGISYADYISSIGMMIYRHYKLACLLDKINNTK